MTETILKLFGMHHRCKYCQDRIWAFYYYVDDTGRRSHGPCYAIDQLITACRGTSRS